MDSTSKNPRIGLVSFNVYAFFNPASPAQLGGSEWQMYQLAQVLAAEGNEVVFVVGDFGQQSIEKHGLITVYKSIALSKQWLNYIQAPFVLWAALWRTKANVYIASPAGPEVGLIALYCKLWHKRFIFRTASAVDCTREKVTSLGVIAGYLYQLGLRTADVIVCQSEQAKAAIKKYHGREAVVINNIIEMPVMTTRKDFILWVGSARAVKQPHIFLELARSMPTEKFMMIMSRTGDMRLWDKIKASAQQIANLQFMGEVPPTKIGEYFSRAIVLVGTSQYEGFPNVYLQALSYGVPIVSLSVNPDNFLTQYNVGYCADGNEDKMRTDLRFLLDDRASYEAKSQAGRQYMATHHDKKIIGQQWVSQISPRHSVQ